MFNDEKFDGLLTIGDVQRAILKSIDLTQPVSAILDQNKIYASNKETIDSIKEKWSVSVPNVCRFLMNLVIWLRCISGKISLEKK